jgi:DNA-binding MarR family transcriptional regulator
MILACLQLPLAPINCSPRLMKIPKRLLENPSFLIDRTAKDAHIQFEEEMRKLDLSRGEWIALAELHFCNGMTQKEMADLMGLGESASGKITQKLLAKGWLVRHPDETDRRAFNVYIADEKRPIVAKLVKLLVMLSDLSLVGFSKTERAEFIGYLNRIRASISRPALPPKWHKLKAELLEDTGRNKG